MIPTHDSVRESVVRADASVSLLLGPHGVGKMSLAIQVADEWSVGRADRLGAGEPFGDERGGFRRLTADAARSIREFVNTHPMGDRKVVFVRLDGAETAAMNILLKSLEEPPPYVRFLLVGVVKFLLTVESRAQRFLVPYLPEPKIAAILGEIGHDPELAARAARAARGTVKGALDAIEEEGDKGLVLPLLRAAAEGDATMFFNALERFQPSARREDGPDPDLLARRCAGMLGRWVVESRTGRWHSFSPEESYGLHRDRDALDLVWRRLFSGARARIAIRTALAPLVEANRG